MSCGNIFLVGPMGVGKTTIGRALAKKLNCEFIDIDAEIESSSGADIAWIFDVEGEDGFRNRETATLDRLSQKNGIVLATGGGAILRDKNRRMLTSRGTVVYLQASIAMLYERTKLDKKRPLLQVDDPKAAIEAIVKQRSPLYESVADIIIETEGKNPQAVATYIEKQVSSH